MLARRTRIWQSSLPLALAVLAASSAAAAAAAGSTSSAADAATGGAKLYFRHGTVSSAKTLALLAVAHTYEVQGKRVLVLKPSIDTRWGAEAVASRAGLSRNADHLIDPEATELPTTSFDGISCILVDEAQVSSRTAV